MKNVVWTGAILILLGLAVLTLGSVPYTTEETIVEVGPVQATAETQESFAIPAAAGWVALGAGSVLVLIGLVGHRQQG